MGTLTITPAHADAGPSYAQNVGRAAHALLAALLAIRPHAGAAEEAPVRRVSWLRRNDDLPQTMMPNLSQELAYMAARQD